MLLLQAVLTPLYKFVAHCSCCRDAINVWKLVLYGIITVHILVRLFIYWNVKLASRVQFGSASLEEATDVLVLPMEFSGMPEIVPLQHRVLVSACIQWRGTAVSTPQKHKCTAV